MIDKREIIYYVIQKLCQQNQYTFIYDPSYLLQSNHSLFDGNTHFTPIGHIQSFNYLYDHFFQSY